MRHKRNKVAVKEYTTEEIIIDQPKSDENAIMIGWANLIDKPNVILSEPAINIKPDENQIEERQRGDTWLGCCQDSVGEEM